MTTNCGRNSIALVRMSPLAYSPASWSVITLRATMMSTLLSAKKAKSAWPL